MEYYIYNNTDYLVSATDVHFVKDSEVGNGGSVGITQVFKVGPKSWATTRRCISDEVETSIASGMLHMSAEKGNIVICTREEYERKTREIASERLETAIGISGQEKESSQSFGFLNKVVKKDDSININDFLIDTECEDFVEESHTEEESSRLDILEKKMELMMESISSLTKVISSSKKEKNTVSKKSTKSSKKVEKKKNANTSKRKR